MKWLNEMITATLKGQFIQIFLNLAMEEVWRKISGVCLKVE